VFDSDKQKRIMGQFATGVTVASTRLGDETWGMTANAFTSLSLDPPLVALCIVRDSQSHAKFKEGGCFAINILAAEDEEISNRFAFKGPKDFSDLPTLTGETGAPILQSAIGWVDCRTVEIVAGGDHDIFIGEIVAGEVGQGDPLMYFQGKYRSLGASSD
jgi:flavin reductase (DIM6/NTAB) family NADH-FMN oxidoreductase RutF